ncbi:sugar ABC transporter ATP-binding protein [Vallicoccus soli]|uniref:Sugar ABC transporter ATP-binding protein n=2 Tax=Vallicoccus soli TaxID=2339232 RepID=A0A3A3ZKS3_9ACTN|nr:sugar ABC transporter ATP-binding protein [Vallicoccus soli]
MHGVSKSFGGVHALRDAHLEVRRGEVHALLGQNGAGKSTLVNILSGVYVDYGGEVSIDGRPVSFRSPAEAQAAGVATIHQELDLVPEMTVAENLFLGREPRTRWGTCDRRRMARDARGLLAAAGVDLQPGRRISSLRVGEQQLVEIAKALSLDARILIMDEPTSALADAEVRRLFDVVRDLKRRGVSVIYISHRLEELAEIADRATVMRDGTVVGTVDVPTTPAGTLIQLMVGQRMEQLFPSTGTEPGEPLLVVDRLTVTPRRPEQGRREPQDVSLVVRAGEVVGLAGLMGSGRTELLETLFGTGPAGTRTGTVTLDGQPLEPAGPRDAIARGVALVTEDRKVSGLALGQSVRSNMTIAALGRVSRGGVVRAGEERRRVARMAEHLRLKAASQSVAVGTLSGGNQQKVIFGRQLMTEPRLLLLDEPTRGVDVGAKAEIYRLLAELAERGIGVLMASSELPELLGTCHRIVVLHEGRVVADLDSRTTTQEEVLAAATTSNDTTREQA